MSKTTPDEPPQNATPLSRRVPLIPSLAPYGAVLAFGLLGQLFCVGLIVALIDLKWTIHVLPPNVLAVMTMFGLCCLLALAASLQVAWLKNSRPLLVVQSIILLALVGSALFWLSIAL